MRVLIADDDRIWRVLLERTLTRLGHEVVVVVDGTQALTALLAAGGPRLAILDWMMPGIDGLEVCRRVRERPAPYVYVVLLTSRDRPEDLVAGLDAGADDFLVKPFNPIELRARLRSGERIIDLEEGLLKAHDAVCVEAARDRLTGLWNRGMILDHLHRELNRTAREATTLAVVVADIDRFKSINDTYGHAAGDAVLQETARRMQAILRKHDAVGRYGGEEFLFVLSECNASGAAQVAERARSAVAATPMVIGDHSLSVTISLGAASTVDVGLGPSALVEAADRALYRAKAHGRNCVESLDALYVAS